MSPLQSGLLLILSGVFSGFGASALTVWLARRTEKDATDLKSGQLELQGRRDAEEMRAKAFSQAYEVSTQTIAGLLRDVARLKVDTAALEERAEKAEEALREARVAFEEYVAKVQELLRGAGIPVPAFEFHRW